jgi:hypothetical protein
MSDFTLNTQDLPMANCKCFTPSVLGNYEESLLGVDQTNYRYADVAIKKCTSCGTNWLHYFVEYEAFPQSGRWYRGVIPDNELDAIKPETAVAFLDKLDWYIFGGSYFSSTGMYGKGKTHVDL